MEGFGEFLGSLFEGASEAASEAAFAAAAGGYESSMPEAGEGGRDVADETYERYLCGGPRALNINDL